MEKKTILIAVVTFIAGTIFSGTVARYAVNTNHTGLMGMYAMHPMTTATTTADSSATSMPMGDTTVGLQNKTGDAFDEAFINEMIAHHQGAIDMANLATSNAKHQEIKDLAGAIITAQTQEIGEMESWQSQWGYGSSNTMMDSHDMTGM